MNIGEPLKKPLITITPEREPVPEVIPMPEIEPEETPEREAPRELVPA